MYTAGTLLYFLFCFATDAFDLKIVHEKCIGQLKS